MMYSPRQWNGTKQILHRRALRRKKRRHHRSDVSEVRHAKKKRSINPIQHCDESGNYVVLKPRHTYWYRSYIMSPHLENPLFHNRFHTRFRLPYDSFLDLLDSVSSHDMFHSWQKKGCKGSPIGLLLLGTLRYLGRGWTFDDLEESTSISEDTHRRFFHVFIKYGSSHLYQKHVVYPTNYDEARTHMEEYIVAGLPGAIGSMDACHVMLEKCSHRLKQNHLGGKSKHTCR